MSSEAPDLDTRIQRIEQQLVAREDRLRRGVDELRERATRSLQPWRRAAPYVGAGLGVALVLALAWRWRTHGAAGFLPQPSHHAPPHRFIGAAAPPSRIPWIQLVTLGWPLLPQRWRARVSPATAATLAGLVLPLIERLRRQRRAY